MNAYEAYEKAKAAQKRMPEFEHIIMHHARYAYPYAMNIIKGRWLEAEPCIMQDRQYAYCYARHIIKGRWIEAEPCIMQDSQYACLYAVYVLKGRWLEAEPTIMKSAEWTYWYARDVVKERWYAAEPYIAKSTWKEVYIVYFFGNEPVVTKDKVDIIQWQRKNAQGYLAPASWFENKISFLDMMVRE